jgi:hypothetical protein
LEGRVANNLAILTATQRSDGSRIEIDNDQATMIATVVCSATFGDQKTFVDQRRGENHLHHAHEAGKVVTQDCAQFRLEGFIGEKDVSVLASKASQVGKVSGNAGPRVHQRHRYRQQKLEEPRAHGLLSLPTHRPTDSAQAG